MFYFSRKEKHIGSIYQFHFFKRIMLSSLLGSQCHKLNFKIARSATGALARVTDSEGKVLRPPEK